MGAGWQLTGAGARPLGGHRNGVPVSGLASQALPGSLRSFLSQGTSVTSVSDLVPWSAGLYAVEISGGRGGWASISPAVSGVWLVAEDGALGG